MREARQAQPILQGFGTTTTKAVKDIIADNKRKEEELWEEEHKPTGPRGLEPDEIEFLEAKEQEDRLRYLEREMQDQQEVDKYFKEVKSRVIQINAQPAVTPTPIAPTSSVSAKKTTTVVKPVVKVLPQKRKTEEEKTEKPSKTSSSSSSSSSSKSTPTSTSSNASDNKRIITKPAAPKTTSLVDYDDDE